jgi:hypothetical protein
MKVCAGVQQSTASTSSKIHFTIEKQHQQQQQQQGQHTTGTSA